jgi:hypothetical protein
MMWGFNIIFSEYIVQIYLYAILSTSLEKCKFVNLNKYLSDYVIAYIWAYSHTIPNKSCLIL